MKLRSAAAAETSVEAAMDDFEAIAATSISASGDDGGGCSLESVQDLNLKLGVQTKAWARDIHIECSKQFK